MIHGRIGETVEAITAMSDVVDQVQDMSGAVANDVEDQGEVTAEITRSAESTASGTERINQRIRRVSVLSDSSHKEAASVYQVANDLKDRSEALNQSVSGFLSAMREAG